MRKFAFGISATALLLMSGAALAGDAGVVNAPAGDWSGLYVGAHVGFGMGATTDSLDCEFGNTAPLGSVSWLAGQGVGCNGTGEPVAITALHNEDGAPWYTDDDLSDMSGWLAGGQLGYNAQMGSLVVGAEVTGSLASISDTGVTEVQLYYSTELEEYGAIYEGTMDVNWIATAVGKLGFALNDKMLVSAVGGLALAGTELSSSAGYSDQQVAQGFTAGAQVEFKLTDNISAFGAYNHMWFNDVSYEGNSLAGVIANFHEYDINLDVVKFGLNYQID